MSKHSRRGREADAFRDVGATGIRAAADAGLRC
jgi:hypothetical protein